jgi:hypothetical protein
MSRLRRRPPAAGLGGSPTWATRLWEQGSAPFPLSRPEISNNRKSRRGCLSPGPRKVRTCAAGTERTPCRASRYPAEKSRPQRPWRVERLEETAKESRSLPRYLSVSCCLSSLGSTERRSGPAAFVTVGSPTSRLEKGHGVVRLAEAVWVAQWVARGSEFLVDLVGAAGFEPATTCAQGRCATRLRHAPTSKLRVKAARGLAPGYRCSPPTLSAMITETGDATPS